MPNKLKWRLPDGVDELLPPGAWRLESIRRAALDEFRCWGYEYVEPPLVEYLDSLLVGSGLDLDLQTLKVIDQKTGRMMGVRADMTSQAVRIDAHSRTTTGVQRLCYSGPVVFANPQEVLASRVPFKAGAELFGSTELTADLEIVGLMLATLARIGVTQPVLMMGHMGVYRALVAELELDAETERAVFAALQRKSESDIAALLPECDICNLLMTLPRLMGFEDQLAASAAALRGAPPAVGEALATLQELCVRLRQAHPNLELRFDLAGLAGYGYHNGPVFVAYLAGQGAPLAQGGRYDGIGEHFGMARPATGFDINLKALVALDEVLSGPVPQCVWAPHAQTLEPAQRSALAQKISALREAQVTVISALSTQESMSERADASLVWQNGTWELAPR